MNGAVLEMRARLQRGQAGRPLYVGGQYLQESVARKTDYTPRRIPETSPARALLDIGGYGGLCHGMPHFQGVRENVHPPSHPY